MTNPTTIDRRDVPHPTNPLASPEPVETLRKPAPDEVDEASPGRLDQIRAEGRNGDRPDKAH